MRLKDYAKMNGVTYQTAYNHWKSGRLKGKKLFSGIIVLEDEMERSEANCRVAVYTRINSNEDKELFKEQLNRILMYTASKGYKTCKIVKEVGSALDDNREKLMELLEDETIDVIVVDHQDRLCKFSLKYIEALLKKQFRRIEIVNSPMHEEKDLLEDFALLVAHYCERLYGKNLGKQKANKLIKGL